MANRVMAQKALKLKRQRRAWNKYGNMKSGIQPSRIVLEEYKQRARGLAFDKSIADKIALGFKGITPARLEAIKRQAEEEARLPEDVTLCFKGPGPCNVYQESWIWTNSKRTVWLVVHKDFKRRVQRTSIIYSSKEVLVIKWEMGKITWKDAETIPPPRK